MLRKGSLIERDHQEGDVEAAFAALLLLSFLTFPPSMLCTCGRRRGWRTSYRRRRRQRVSRPDVAVREPLWDLRSRPPLAAARLERGGGLQPDPGEGVTVHGFLLAVQPVDVAAVGEGEAYPLVPVSGCGSGAAGTRCGWSRPRGLLPATGTRNINGGGGSGDGPHIRECAQVRPDPRGAWGRCRGRRRVAPLARRLQLLGLAAPGRWRGWGGSHGARSAPVKAFTPPAGRGGYGDFLRVWRLQWEMIRQTASSGQERTAKAWKDMARH